MSKLVFKPLGNRVQIKPREMSVTKAGVFIPAGTTGTYPEGDVIAVSETANTILKVGDRVMYIPPPNKLEDGTELVHPDNVYGIFIRIETEENTIK